MAGLIPQDFIDTLLARTDVVDLIDARVPLRKAGREFVACCPFHTEKSPSFTVSPDKQFYHCFGCGAHGSAIGFLMAYEHLGFVEAVEELARSAGLDLPREARPTPAVRDHADLHTLTERAAGHFRRQLREHPERERAIAYLKQRGLSGEIAAAYGIGYAPDSWDGLTLTLRGEGAPPESLVAAGLAIARKDGGCYDRFRGRIMFPIRDRGGRVIAFGGRALGDETPKYLNSPETPLFHKGRELYGLYEARLAERQLRQLLIVEGYMDVVALAQFGIRNAVATLGTATTRDHVERLFRVTRDLVFCFDGDRAGREAAWRALETALPALQDGRQVRFLFLPDGEDPDSLLRKAGRAGFDAQLAGARQLDDVLFERLGSDIDLSNLAERARLVDTARPLIERIPEGAQRELMLARLAQISGVAQKPVETATPPAKPDSPRRARPTLTHSPVRRAIALLLQQPALAQQEQNLDALRGHPEAGVDLLLELLERLRANPQLHAAALLERYRDTPEGRVLEQLARWQPEIGAELYAADFDGALAKLRARADPRRLLIDKMARGELTAEEWERLRQLTRGEPTAP